MGLNGNENVRKFFHSRQHDIFTGFEQRKLTLVEAENICGSINLMNKEHGKRLKITSSTTLNVVYFRVECVSHLMFQLSLYHNTSWTIESKAIVLEDGTTLWRFITIIKFRSSAFDEKVYTHIFGVDFTRVVSVFTR